MAYEPRTYRRTVEPQGLVCFEVAVKETDLQVCAARDLSDRAGDLAIQARWDIEEYIRTTPRFADSMVPIDVREDAPEIVRRMAEAGRVAKVGPMASVAGAIAEHVARGLSADSPDVIVENGGDVYLVGEHDRTLALWTGSEGVQRVGIEVRAGLMPVACCTSSGTIGHSTSFGTADAVTVLSRNGALADAVATALANQVRTHDDIARAIEVAQEITGILGVVVAVGDSLGAWGNVRLVSLEA